MPHLVLPRRDQRPYWLGGITGAFSAGDGLTEIQLRLIREFQHQLDGGEIPDDEFEPQPAAVVREALDAPDLIEQLATVVLVLELVMHPLPRAVEQAAAAYLDELGVAPGLRAIVHDTASHHGALLHADITRQNWTTSRTVDGLFHGKLLELVRSKLSYLGVGSDEDIAEPWRALGQLDEGTWGRAVYDFYKVRGFPFPGEPHGIYEIGARHDWVHVLADYDSTPAGEICVFAFIATSMNDPRGLTMVAFTLALFQNATINRVFGKPVAIARADTLADDGVVPEVVEALLRGDACTVDVMDGIDPFDLAEEPLDAIREQFAIPPRTTELDRVVRTSE